ncbi:DNA ligase D [Granulicella cerasi]|uniref:DNA ligase (ATP) n=1 Tax=Granulicella cerasi TaxID=741063 RepID=A0ABW1Z3U0_9BACT|nr:DNA ligase D [Granulicella cerasi]
MATKKTTTKKSTKSAPAKPRAAKKSTVSADAVDEQLARYRSMRDFKITDEPAGSDKPLKSKPAKTTRATSMSRGLPFVIQKHAASHLHYDFRLGWAGVLKSWAVAKGPSFNPKDRRLAIEVEDHPMEYGGFEGIIPEGQYGGGTVMVWDQGTWWPQPGHENVSAGLREGSLKFEMHGKKMRGKWTLVRMKPRPGEKKPQWLLIKEHDEFERGPDDKCITDSEPNSAVTGRSLDQIAGEGDHVWNSKDTAGTGKAWYRRAPGSTEPTAQEPPKLKKAGRSKARLSHDSTLDPLPRESQPDFLPPQLAVEATEPPATAAWLHEIKLDGYRIQARKHGDKVQLLTRKGLDWTHRMKPVAEAVSRLAVDDVTLDGEVCVIDEHGVTSFAALQAWFQQNEPAPLTYFAFDLLHLDGHNPRNLPLRERKQILAKLLTNADETLQLSEDVSDPGSEVLAHACKLHAEGIVSKRADAPYRGTRSNDWLKSKCLREQEFVICGWTDSSTSAHALGSLLLGVYDDAGTLHYCGRTGTGFTQTTRKLLHAQLAKLAANSCPFPRKPADARSDVHWVKPRLVAQVRFATWTSDNLVRQAAFLGLREDKPAEEVRREEATVAPTPKAARAAHTTHAHAAHMTKPAAKATEHAPVRLTHPDKILDTESQLTKQELADYYWAVAPHMLPALEGRPLSLVRCPEGAGHPCFYQKHANHTLPAGVGSVMVPDKKTGDPEPYITLDTPEALAGLAQMGVLEVHPWGSRNDNLEHPDRLILDLDPDESLTWPTLAAAAEEVRKLLKKLGLTSFLKTTGGKGLHVVAPLEPTLTWPELKDAAHRIVLSLERQNPALYLTKMTKAARVGKIYLDYLRNERGATAVAPFSPRARLGCAVSFPLPWSALKEKSHPRRTVKDFPTWRDELRHDPWKAFASTRQRLELSNVKELG